MTPKIEKVVESVILGESPHWEPVTQSLYFVDIGGKSIHKYVPATKKHTKVILDQHVSFIIPIKGQKNKFIISQGRELVSITWDGSSDKVSDMKKVAEVDTENKDNVFNDGKCDSTGRLWAGTLEQKSISTDSPGKGSLYSITKNTVKAHVDTLKISNGLDFNPALKKMYFADSATFTVDQFDLDEKAGTISNRKVVFSLSKFNIPGMVDGITLDSDGNLWLAIFGGGRVIKIDPRKTDTLLETILIPAEQTTCVLFGGPNMDELYVTTAKFPTPEKKVFNDSIDGVTYKVTGLGAKGLPAVEFVL